jgi:hypothetical protein
VTNILLILGRLFVILIGYIVAAFAAAAFFNVMMLGAAGFFADAPPWAVTASFAAGIPFVALITAYYAFVPAMIVIVLTELLGKRDWLTHALGGGVVSLVVMGFLRHLATLRIGDAEGGFTPDTRFTDDPRMAMLLIGTGLIGGIAYWLVAGNSAGSWKNDFNKQR